MRRLGIGPKHLSPRKGRTGKSPHELRDLFRSQWAKSTAKGDVAEFCMGHMIDPLDYNKAWRDEKFYRDEYMKAVPYLQIMSSGQPYHMVGEEEIEKLRKEVAELRATAESRKEPDTIMDRLFEDPEFKILLQRKLKDLKI